MWFILCACLLSATNDLKTPDGNFVLQPGDIFVTRNLKEEDNTSPGYWNHSAIYVGEDTIVEAQPDPNKVITIGVQEFYDRYPYVAILRVNHPKGADLGKQASLIAKASVNTTYKKFASVFRHLRKAERGENCVSVVRRAWSKVLKVNISWWKTPDGIYKTPIFKIVHTKGVKE